MGGLSVWKLLLILTVVLVVFGGKRLPELGKSLGDGLANFRRSFKEAEQDQGAIKSEDAPKKVTGE